MPEVREICPLLTKDPKNPARCNSQCAWYIGTKCSVKSIAENLSQLDQHVQEVSTCQKA